MKSKWYGRQGFQTTPKDIRSIICSSKGDKNHQCQVYAPTAPIRLVRADTAGLASPVNSQSFHAEAIGVRSQR